MLRLHVRISDEPLRVCVFGVCVGVCKPSYMGRDAGRAVTTEPALIWLEGLSDVLRAPHLVILSIHSANEISSQNRASASGRTGAAAGSSRTCLSGLRVSSVSGRIMHAPALVLLPRKPRINSQLVAQQVAQQYPMPPPPKKERRERSERADKDRTDGEGERANEEARPEVDRPERVRSEGDTPEKEKSDKEQPIQDKHGTEKDISPAVTKKPGSKKARSVTGGGGGRGGTPPPAPLWGHAALFSHASVLPQTQIGQPPEPPQRQTQHTVWQVGDQDQQELSHFQVCVTVPSVASHFRCSCRNSRQQRVSGKPVIHTRSFTRNAHSHFLCARSDCCCVTA